MNADGAVLSGTELYPSKCTFQYCVPCIDFAADFFALISSLVAFIHVLLSHAYCCVC